MLVMLWGPLATCTDSIDRAFRTLIRRSVRDGRLGRLGEALECIVHFRHWAWLVDDVDAAQGTEGSHFVQTFLCDCNYWRVWRTTQLPDDPIASRRRYALALGLLDVLIATKGREDSNDARVLHNEALEVIQSILENIKPFVSKSVPLRRFISRLNNCRALWRPGDDDAEGWGEE